MERSIKELLEVCIQNWDVEYNKNLNSFGLCNYINDLFGGDFISDVEFKILTNFLDSNEPTRKKHPQFYVDHLAYWWKIDDEEIRLDFLKYLFKITGT